MQKRPIGKDNLPSRAFPVPDLEVEAAGRHGARQFTNESLLLKIDMLQRQLAAVTGAHKLLRTRTEKLVAELSEKNRELEQLQVQAKPAPQPGTDDASANSARTIALLQRHVRHIEQELWLRQLEADMRGADASSSRVLELEAHVEELELENDRLRRVLHAAARRGDVASDSPRLLGIGVEAAPQPGHEMVGGDAGEGGVLASANESPLRHPRRPRRPAAERAIAEAASEQDELPTRDSFAVSAAHAVLAGPETGGAIQAGRPLAPPANDDDGTGSEDDADTAGRTQARRHRSSPGRPASAGRSDPAPLGRRVSGGAHPVSEAALRRHPRPERTEALAARARRRQERLQAKVVERAAAIEEEEAILAQLRAARAARQAELLKERERQRRQRRILELQQSLVREQEEVRAMEKEWHAKRMRHWEAEQESRRQRPSLSPTRSESGSPRPGGGPRPSSQRAAASPPEAAPRSSRSRPSAVQLISVDWSSTGHSADLVRTTPSQDVASGAPRNVAHGAPRNSPKVPAAAAPAATSPVAQRSPSGSSASSMFALSPDGDDARGARVESPKSVRRAASDVPEPPGPARASEDPRLTETARLESPMPALAAVEAVSVTAGSACGSATPGGVEPPGPVRSTDAAAESPAANAPAVDAEPVDDTPDVGRTPSPRPDQLGKAGDEAPAPDQPPPEEAKGEAKVEESTQRVRPDVSPAVAPHVASMLLSRPSVLLVHPVAAEGVPPNVPVALRASIRSDRPMLAPAAVVGEPVVASASSAAGRASWRRVMGAATVLAPGSWVGEMGALRARDEALPAYAAVRSERTLTLSLAVGEAGSGSDAVPFASLDIPIEQIVGVCVGERTAEVVLQARAGEAQLDEQAAGAGAGAGADANDGCPPIVCCAICTWRMGPGARGSSSGAGRAGAPVTLTARVAWAPLDLLGVSLADQLLLGPLLVEVGTAALTRMDDALMASPEGTGRQERDAWVVSVASPSRPAGGDELVRASSGPVRASKDDAEASSAMGGGSTLVWTSRDRPRVALVLGDMRPTPSATASSPLLDSLAAWRARLLPLLTAALRPDRAAPPRWVLSPAPRLDLAGGEALSITVHRPGAVRSDSNAEPGAGAGVGAAQSAFLHASLPLRFLVAAWAAWASSTRGSPSALASPPLAPWSIRPLQLTRWSKHVGRISVPAGAGATLRPLQCLQPYAPVALPLLPGGQGGGGGGEGGRPMLFAYARMWPLGPASWAGQPGGLRVVREHASWPQAGDWVVGHGWHRWLLPGAAADARVLRAPIDGNPLAVGNVLQAAGRLLAAPLALRVRAVRLHGEGVGPRRAHLRLAVGPAPATVPEGVAQERSALGVLADARTTASDAAGVWGAEETAEPGQPDGSPTCAVLPWPGGWAWSCGGVVARVQQLGHASGGNGDVGVELWVQGPPGEGGWRGSGDEGSGSESGGSEGVARGGMPHAAPHATPAELWGVGHMSLLPVAVAAVLSTVDATPEEHSSAPPTLAGTPISLLSPPSAAVTAASSAQRSRIASAAAQLEAGCLVAMRPVSGSSGAVLVAASLAFVPAPPPLAPNVPLLPDPGTLVLRFPGTVVVEMAREEGAGAGTSARALRAGAGEPADEEEVSWRVAATVLARPGAKEVMNVPKRSTRPFAAAGRALHAHAQDTFPEGAASLQLRWPGARAHGSVESLRRRARWAAQRRLTDAERLLGLSAEEVEAEAGLLDATAPLPSARWSLSEVTQAESATAPFDEAGTLTLRVKLVRRVVPRVAERKDDGGPSSSGAESSSGAGAPSSRSGRGGQKRAKLKLRQLGAFQISGVVRQAATAYVHALWRAAAGQLKSAGDVQECAEAAAVGAAAAATATDARPHWALDPVTGVPVRPRGGADSGAGASPANHPGWGRLTLVLREAAKHAWLSNRIMLGSRPAFLRVAFIPMTTAPLALLLDPARVALVIPRPLRRAVTAKVEGAEAAAEPSPAPDTTEPSFMAHFSGEDAPPSLPYDLGGRFSPARPMLAASVPGGPPAAAGHDPLPFFPSFGVVGAAGGATAPAPAPEEGTGGTELPYPPALPEHVAMGFHGLRDVNYEVKEAK